MKKIIADHALLFLFICIVICAAFSTVLYMGRIQPHVDEVWSYMLSNKSDSPFLYAHCAGVGEETEDLDNFKLTETESYKAYFHHWHDSDYYQKALTVQPEDRFSYGRVSYNQSLDVHPPLYYYLLHTICSFFPNQFSWWFSYSINLVFYIGTLIMLYITARKLKISRDKSLLCVLLWGLSAAGTNEICFLRMYMMLTFFMLCITYLHLLLLHDFRIRYIVGIMVLDTLSFLTQYYAYIYVFFITLFFIIRLFRKREFKKGLHFGFAILSCVGLAILIFPAAIRHIFAGHYSDTVTYGTHSSLLQGANAAMGIVFENYTGIYLNTMLIITVLFFLFLIIKLIQFNKIEHTDKVDAATLKKIGKYIVDSEKNSFRKLFPEYDKSVLADCILILTSMIAASAIIIKISPDMGVLTVRYLFLILPLFSVLLVRLADMLLTVLGSRKTGFKKYHTVTLAILCALCITGSYMLREPSSFLQNAKGKNNEFLQYFESSDIILIDDTHHTQAFTPMLMNAESVYPTDEIDDGIAAAIAHDSSTEHPLCLVISETQGNLYTINKKVSDAFEGHYKYLGYFYCTTDDPMAHSFYQIIK